MMLKKHLLPIVIIAAVTMSLYRDVFSQSFLTNWDDALYVTANQAARGLSLDNLRLAFSSFYAGNYAPLQIISYMADYEIWGNWAGGYKLTNLLLHILTGITFYFTLCRHFAMSRIAAFCAAALFLTHPVQVESVAWISQRKTVLSGLFMTLSFHAYLDWLNTEPNNRRSWALLSIMSYVFALLAKTTTVVLLPIMFLYEWVTFRRITLRDKLPFLAATVIMVIMTLISQSPDNHGGISHYHGGSPYTTLLTMVTVLPQYLGLIFWPLKLSAVYAPPIHKTLNLTVVMCGSVWLALFALGAYLFAKKPGLAFWYIIFFLGLLPVSQVVPIATIMNDRYLYVPLMGAAGCLAYGLSLVEKLPPTRLRSYALVATSMFLIPFALITSRQVGVWRNSVTLWTSATDRVKTAPEAWTGLANACQQDRKFAAALSAYLQAIKLKPDNDIAMNNIALLYLSLGKIRQAEEYATFLLRINKSAVAYTTVAMVHFARQEYVEAEEMLRHALSKDPNLETALTLMGSIATEQGRYDVARQFLDRSLELHGPIGPVLYALASLDGAMGNREVSRRLLIRALEAGYQDVDALRENRHLTPVTQDPEMAQIINHFIPGAHP